MTIFISPILDQLVLVLKLFPKLFMQGRDEQYERAFLLSYCSALVD